MKTTRHQGPAMTGLIVQTRHPSGEFEIPGWVTDFRSFVRWTDSEDFPTLGRFSFIHGKVWMDLSMEELFTHGRLKVRVTSAFESIATSLNLGYVFSDRTRFHNLINGLSVEPDVLFFSFDAVREGRVRLTEGAEEGYMSIEGSPEVVVEIVSMSSVTKDTDVLREAYFEAGVSEYWLIDGRRSAVSFDILKRGPRGYTSTRAHAGGWLKSNVFGRSFRITQTTDPLGNPQFTLEHRD